MLNNCKGNSVLESLLAVTILFFIAGFLLPKFSDLKSDVEIQKIQTHAAEVAFNGARLVRDYGKTSGVFEIENITYNWEYVNNQICVAHFYIKDWQKCIG